MAAPRHRDLTYVVMASGPSMCQSDADMVRGKARVIAINNTFHLAPWADIIYGCDNRWWDKYHANVKAICTGDLWAYQPQACEKYGLNKCELKKTGGNGGYQAVRLAITEFSADRVILLGFDMKEPGHWHPEHGQGWPNPTVSNFKQWRVHLQQLGLEFPNVEIINCSMESAIECFPKMELSRALSCATGQAQNMAPTT